MTITFKSDYYDRPEWGNWSSNDWNSRTTDIRVVVDRCVGSCEMRFLSGWRLARAFDISYSIYGSFALNFRGRH